jgi:DNA-binding CsgD family transcriptional regulator
MVGLEVSALLLAITAAGAKGDFCAILAALQRHFRADEAQLRLSAKGWSGLGEIEQTLPDVFLGLRFGRVYTGAELAARGAWPSASPQLGDCRAIGLRLAEGAGWLIVSRHHTEFRAVDSATLAALAPHVAQAFMLAEEFAQLQARATGAAQHLHIMGLGLVHWDRFGRAVAQDDIAHVVLAGLPSSADLPQPQAGVFFCNPAPGVEMAVHWGAHGQPIGILRAAKRPLPAPKVLAQAFGLSQPEARLAHALGEGCSLRQAAEKLGVTLETARSYSKQIFAKTGTRGQPDLIRRIWAGLLPLAGSGE